MLISKLSQDKTGYYILVRVNFVPSFPIQGPGEYPSSATPSLGKLKVLDKTQK